jgi:hypothetical protein
MSVAIMKANHLIPPPLAVTCPLLSDEQHDGRFS